MLRCATPHGAGPPHACPLLQQAANFKLWPLAFCSQGQFDPAARWAFQAVAVCSVAGQLCFRLACAFNLFNCNPLFGCAGPAALFAGCGPLLLALAPLLWGQWVSLSQHSGRRKERADSETAPAADSERVRASDPAAQCGVTADAWSAMWPGTRAAPEKPSASCCTGALGCMDLLAASACALCAVARHRCTGGLQLVAAWPSKQRCGQRQAAVA